MAGKKQAEEGIATYGAEELLGYAQELFGVKPEVLKGALHGSKGKESYTIEGVKTLIQQFLNRKVN